MRKLPYTKQLVPQDNDTNWGDSVLTNTFQQGSDITDGVGYFEFLDLFFGDKLEDPTLPNSRFKDYYTKQEIDSLAKPNFYLSAYNLGVNVGGGSSPSYASTACQLSLSPNGDTTTEAVLMKNTSYRNGGISPIIPISDIEINRISFKCVGARVAGPQLSPPFHLTLQLWEVQIDSATHTFIQDIEIPVIIGEDQVLANNNTGGLVVGRLDLITPITLLTNKFYGLTVKEQAQWDQENNRISLCDRLVIIARIKGDI